MEEYDVVEMTALAAGAAALLLERPERAAGMGEATLDLVAATDAAVLATVQGWQRAGGADGEQFLALSDLLHARAGTHADLAASLVAVGAHRASTAEALLRLAGRLDAGGFSGAAGWARTQSAALSHGAGTPTQRQARRGQPTGGGSWLQAAGVPFRDDAGRHGGPAERASDPGQDSQGPRDEPADLSPVAAR